MNKFFMTEEVTDFTANAFLSFVDEQNGEDFSIHIDSVGGDVFAGLRIISAIQNYKGEITAECGIVVASIAAVIALVCPKITATKDTFVMVHKPWAATCGTAEELLSTAELLDEAGKRIENIIRDRAKDKDAVQDWLKADKWFGAESFATAFGGVELVSREDGESGALFEVVDKFKSAPQELVSIAAKLREEKEQAKEPEKEPEIDNSFAQAILAKLETLKID